MFGRKKDNSRFSAERQEPAQPFVEQVRAPIESRPADIVYPEKPAPKNIAIAFGEIPLPSKSYNTIEEVMADEYAGPVIAKMIRQDIESDRRLSLVCSSMTTTGGSFSHATRYPSQRNEAYAKALCKNLHWEEPSNFTVIKR